MRNLTAMNAIMGLNIVVLAGAFAALAARTTPAAFAQNQPVDLASQQRAELIGELRVVNGHLRDALALMQKLADDDDKRQEAQVEGLERIRAGLADAASAAAAGHAERHDDLMGELLDLSALVEEGMGKMGEDDAARFEELRTNDAQQWNTLRELLEAGKVKVIIVEEKKAEPEKE